ncbi:hypothetical protein PSN45_002667 [Yamadazyma tenuis]|uniref:Uncharacterized protein n=1 Tax=Candida tenuis (strain ATCC 10573 / BCRC 21748 / CBS 615 / JCM 9827 / NBRC 10315 / NRRL Y-1498 / VKM Y-70) TaxID=590646 RepID=G3AX80_CANTC|nr:uncharacterized protein CANTEDRAFT_132968 [Yamadazyma tenuis ATCC 10573]EGV66711.1 hypothetical protein CANTEDRAFT_132968 [Yamadazyma tenuis ATCC 10573]WEJ95154.1 hypothetical protein PSN45_002667 [Yamadazyma tenuis]
MAKRISLLDKKEIIRFHKIQASRDPHHKQTHTIKHFAHQFTIPKSTLNRWLIEDSKLKKSVVRREKPLRQPLVNIEEEYVQDEKPAPRIETPEPVDPSEDFDLKGANMVSSILVQHFTEMTLQKQQVQLDFNLVKAVTHAVKRIFPDIRLPKPAYFMNQLTKENIVHLEGSLTEQLSIKQTYSSLSKESLRLDKMFKSYESSHIYQFNEFTINLTEYLELFGEDVRLKLDLRNKNYCITVGIGFNLSGTEFLKPVIVTNFSDSINDPDVIHNQTGFMSNYIFNRYFGTLNRKFRDRRQRVLFIIDRTSNHFLANKFTHIKLLYNNLNNFPLNFGIQSMYAKAVTVSILDHFQRESNLNAVPDIVKVSLNHMSNKLSSSRAYSKFFSHCIDLCLNHSHITNYSKLIRIRMNSSFHYSNTSKCLVLNSHENYIKNWLKKLQLPVFCILSKSATPKYDLDTIVKSNFIKEHRPNPEEPLDMKNIITMRRMLESSGASITSMSLFDQLYTSLSQDLLQLEDEIEDWNSDDNFDLDSFDLNSVTSIPPEFLEPASTSHQEVQHSSTPQTSIPFKHPSRRPSATRDRSSSISQTSATSRRMSILASGDRVNRIAQFSDAAIESDSEMDSQFAYLSDISNNSDSLRRVNRRQSQIKYAESMDSDHE